MLGAMSSHSVRQTNIYHHDAKVRRPSLSIQRRYCLEETSNDHLVLAVPKLVQENFRVLQSRLVGRVVSDLASEQLCL